MISETDRSNRYALEDLCVSKEKMMSEGALVFENIREGFEQYNSEILTMDHEEAKAFFAGKRQCCSNVYVDFYYGWLDDNARQAVLGMLDEKEKAYVLSLDTSGIYFKMTDQLLDIAVKLNAAEMLFCTVYFADTKETFWGNYRQQYVRFWKSEPDVQMTT